MIGDTSLRIGDTSWKISDTSWKISDISWKIGDTSWGHLLGVRVRVPRIITMRANLKDLLRFFTTQEYLKLGPFSIVANYVSHSLT